MIELASGVIKQDNLLMRIEATAGLVFATTGLVAVTAVVLLLERIFNATRNSISLKVSTEWMI